MKFKNQIVKLYDRQSKLVIVGKLSVLNDGTAKVIGTADGITTKNYLQIRPTNLDGPTGSAGNVWLKNVYRFSPTVKLNDSFPALVNLRAIHLYMGGFDPADGKIRAAYAPLTPLATLSGFRPFISRTDAERNIVRTYKIGGQPADVLDNKELKIRVEQLANIGDQIEYEQNLALYFTSGISGDAAIRLTDSALLFIALLTQSNVLDRSVDFIDETGKSTREVREAKQKTRHAGSHEWLVEHDAMVSFLKDHFDTWMRALATEENYLLARWFNTAAHRERTSESKFLLYCQCFEELNRRRIGDLKHDKSDFELIVSQLAEKISTLKAPWLNGEMKSRLRASIRSANTWKLSDRIKETMNLVPGTNSSINSYASDMRFKIERRRNKLSHGNVGGSPLGQEEYEKFLLELSVIRVMCLTEILLLASVKPADLDDFVRRDVEMRNFNWRASRIRERSA